MGNWEEQELLHICAKISYEAHDGQYRRDGLTPYIDHPREVANRVTTFDEQCLAWLHDVLEDTGLTAQALRDKGVPEQIIDGVTYMTKRDGESYIDYLCGIRNNPLAKSVKIADMLHNLSDNPTRKQVIKYSKGLLFLLED